MKGTNVDAVPEPTYEEILRVPPGPKPTGGGGTPMHFTGTTSSP